MVPHSLSLTLKKLGESTLRIVIIDISGLSAYTKFVGLLIIISSCALIYATCLHQERQKCYVVWLGFPGPNWFSKGSEKQKTRLVLLHESYNHYGLL